MKKFNLDTDSQLMVEEIIGENIAELLNLKLKSNGRYNTVWGDKTAVGLYHCIQRILDNDV